MSVLISKINKTIEIIRKVTKEDYPIGIILGTGLGGLAKEIEIQHEIEHGLSSPIERHANC